LELIKPAFADLKKDFIYHNVVTGVILLDQQQKGLAEYKNRIVKYQNIIGGYYQVCYKPKKSGYFKVPAITFEFMGKKYSTEPRTVIVRKAKDDGRFTLGAGETRIMYGFPIPLSTSHFVVKINEKFASNSLSINAKHITTNGRETVKKDGKSYVQMRYSFEDCNITQKIIPVTAALQMADIGSNPQYYKIVYEIENNSRTNKKVALNLLIDIMIGGNDAAQVGYAGQDAAIIDIAKSLSGKAIPERLWIYEQTNDKGKMIAELRNDTQDTIQSPQEIYIGNWAEFYRTLWEVKSKKEKYKDSGMMVRWDGRMLPPGGKTTFSTYYGLPDFKMTELNQLSLLFDEPEMVASVEEVLYYGDNNPELNATQAKKIKKMLSKIAIKDILGISIEGFSDAKGTLEENFQISQKRAESVANYLSKQGIAKYRLMPKGYGNTFARPQATKMEAAEDRKVILRIVYEEKNKKTE
jgi:outer membrane protein OmpA-like peptidoglycan-associated protein